MGFICWSFLLHIKRRAAEMLPPLLALPLGAPPTSVEALASVFSQLLRSDVDVDTNTGKRKVDGSRAAMRIGATTTER